MGDVKRKRKVLDYTHQIYLNLIYDVNIYVNES